MQRDFTPRGICSSVVQNLQSKHIISSEPFANESDKRNLE